MPVVQGKSAARKTATSTPSGARVSEEHRVTTTHHRMGKRWAYSRRGYALSQSFKQFGQRKIASIVTLLVFGVTLALPALILFSASALAELGNRSVGEESMTVYLSLDTTDLDGATLAQQWSSLPDVRDARYVSRDEALAIFNQQADINDAIEMLGRNPLPGAIIVFPNTTAINEQGMQRLAAQLESESAADRVQLDLKWVQRLQAVLNLARTVGWILAGFLTLTALLVIGNTIRLELLRRQSEFDVARLLGASRSFLHRPLLYMGALYGFLGGMVACGIAVLALSWIQGPSAELATLYGTSFRLEMPTASQLALVVACASFLGILGAIATLYQPSRQLLPVRRTGI